MYKKNNDVLMRIDKQELISDLETIEYTTITNNKKLTYMNLEVAFDIETTSTMLADGTKSAFMYIWTFAIKNSDYVYFGRTWEEFTELLSILQEYFELNSDKRMIVYVHNLAYEFQFMRKYMEWVDVFSLDERKPVKALSQYGIEFKDSYILSGMDLSRLAKNLVNHNIAKLEEDFDYDLIRHNNTVLSEKELQYCINDVVIILYYINEQIDIYGDITKIPLTNTGRVRQYVRHECYYTNNNHKKSSSGKFYRYRAIMNDLQLSLPVYNMCKRAFMGGFTHANANHMGKTLDNVTSIDFTSSYPAVMLMEKFPMSKPIPTTFNKKKDFAYYNSRFALLFDVKFTNLRSKISQDNYISESKCLELINPVLNNGRVNSADTLITTITNVDLNIIENVYEWDSIEVSNVFRFYMGYLPKPIIDSIIKLYEDKTVLKNVKGSEVEYVLSKGMLNSIYGMCVTEVIRDEIEYGDEWKVTPNDEEEQIKQYNEGINRFLYYPWGIWITAYARRNLWMGIVTMGDDYIYSDTDSIKFLNHDKYKPFIKGYNNMVEEKLKNMCNHYSINYDKMKPKTVEGVVKVIGLWDLDGHYDRFKTLGAKRYLVEHKGSKRMETTIAGLSKANGLEYMLEVCGNDSTKVFEMFNDELYIPSERTGKMTHTYIDNEQEYQLMDFQGNEGTASAKSSIHLDKCDFTLSITRQYLDFIEQLKQGYIYTGQRTI